MIFIIRTNREDVPGFDVKMRRRTPGIVPDSTGKYDHFCLGDPEAANAAALPVVAVHDGWYADDRGGGMAIWGQGLFWEVRDTPFNVTQACGPESWPPKPEENADGDLNLRQAIFRG
jgi:hypothetical protein